MKAYVGFSTSLRYWLRHGTDVPCYRRRAHTKSLNDAACTQRELRACELGECGLDRTSPKGWPSRRRKRRGTKADLYRGDSFHVLVPGTVDRNPIEGYERHAWTSHIPDGSFCILRPDILVSSPEFSFLQVAGLLSLQQLVLVGYWLCASYRVREDGITIPVDSVTTVGDLEEYVRQADGCYGAKKARNALRWVVDGARSPMEASLAMLASLPVRYGGYGFRKPCINYRIDASAYDPTTLDRPDRKYFEIDLYWADKRVGLEYDGSDHYDRARIRLDRRRINCLQANGERILVVMFDQLMDQDVREVLMSQLAKMLGVRMRATSESDDESRDALLGILFGGEFAL